MPDRQGKVFKFRTPQEVASFILVLDADHDAVYRWDLETSVQIIVFDDAKREKTEAIAEQHNCLNPGEAWTTSVP